MDNLPVSIRRIPIRLAIVVLLSLLVAGACYGVSLTPVSQAMMSSRGGPPAGRGGANPAAKPSGAVATPAGAVGDSTAGVAAAGGVAVGAPGAAGGVAATGSGAAISPAAPMTRPAGGGGRPASLQRGLPELARNAGVIAVLIVIVAGLQTWLRTRRRPLARRAAA